MSHDRQATDSAASPERMLTAKEAAAELNVSISTVYRLGDRLAAQKFGTGEVRPRGFRIPESKVAELKRPTAA